MVKSKTVVRRYHIICYCYVIEDIKSKVETVGAALERLIADMDDVDRLELARDVVHECRVYIMRQIATLSRAEAGPESLAPWEAMKEKFQTEYDLVLFGVDKPEERAAAIERAITEHRRFLIEKNKGQNAPKGNTGELDGGPK